MKKLLFTLFVVLISIAGYAQTPKDFSADDVVSIKTPDVAAIESVNFLPVNEYTGRINIDIPIYTIDLDGLSIPISISYNSGGVKVNTISSRVGLNWSLNAGGVISKEIKGMDDLGKETEVFNTNEVTYSKWGFIVGNYATQYHPIWEPGKDGQPDLFFVSAPSLNTVFTHKSNGETMELNPKANKILSTVNNTSQNTGYYFDAFNITNSSGFVYNFEENEKSEAYSYTYNDPHDIIYTIDGSAPYTPSGSGYSYDAATSLKLTKITSPVSKSSVLFSYDSITVYNHDLYIERKYDNAGNFRTQTDHWKDQLDVKLIKKITFDSGEINFYYTSGRLDLTGEKKLTKIEVIDNFGKLIKRVHFIQSYFSSSDNCNDPECLRLKLDEIYYTDVNNTILPGYKFIYNTSQNLPKRRSYKQDFMGYYNGFISTSTTKFIPTLYYKANQGRNSILPFNLYGQGYVAQTGTYAVTSNLAVATAASLTGIKYPTGGYAEFYYELNSFLFMGQEIQGGGLRIKSHLLVDENFALKRQINYDYKKDNGLSSGSILFVPLWGRFVDAVGQDLLTIYQRSLNGYELTKNSYVGYSRVKVSEVNNGYIVKKFTSPESSPNLYPTNFTYVVGGTGPYATIRRNWFDYRINNGTFPNLWQSTEILRGNLLSIDTYNNTNVRLSKKENQYHYIPLDSVTTHDNFYYPDGALFYDAPYYLRAFSTVKSERNYLSKSISTLYLANGSNITETNFVYDNNKTKPFIKEKSTLVNNNKTLKEKYFYPYNIEVSGLPEVSNLISQNIISSPVKTESYSNTVLLSTKYTKFKNWGNSIILPEIVQSSKGSQVLENRLMFYSYDNKGNPTELSQADGTHIVYIWGYQQTQPLAKITNTTLSTITAAQQTLINDAVAASDLDKDKATEVILIAKLQLLREGFPNVQVSSYTYDPLIGITSITDPRGKTSTYIYDTFNRLSLIKDPNDKIVKRYDYNFKNQQ